MECGAGSGPASYSSGAASTRVILGCHPGGLLWSTDQSCRYDSPSPSGKGCCLRLPRPDRDGLRKRPTSPHGGQDTAVQAAPLLTGVQPDRKRRLPSTRPERTTDQGRGRRRLGPGVGSPARGRRGRPGQTEGEGAGAPARAASPGRCGTRGRPRSPTAGRREGSQEVKEGQEKEEGQDRRVSQRSESGQGGPKGLEPLIRWHGPRPQGEGPKTGVEACPKAGLPQKEAVQLQQQPRQQRDQQFDGVSWCGAGRRVFRGDEDQGDRRAISGSLGFGNAPEHASQLADNSRRRKRPKGHKSNSSPLLPECPGEKGKWTASKRVTDAGNYDRHPAQREDSAGGRYTLPASKGPGGNVGWYPLGSGPESGARVWRGHGSSREGGTSVSPEGELFGRTGQVAKSVLRDQGSPQGQDERQGSSREGRQEGREQARQRQGGREEGMSGLEHSDGGAYKAAMNAPGPGAGCMQFPEDEARSYATPGGFLGTVPVPEAMSSPVASAVSAEGNVSPVGSDTAADPVADLSTKFFPVKSHLFSLGDPVFFENQGHSAEGLPGSTREGLEKRLGNLLGSRLVDVGLKIQQWLLEVLPLRSQHMGRRTHTTLFPLPTSSSLLLGVFPDLSALEVGWLSSVCMSLNSLWGNELHFDGDVNDVTKSCLDWIVKDVVRFGSLTGKLEQFDWDGFFSTRGIDYKGDEIKTAREFTWRNIAPALPKEVGCVPLAEVCTLGACHYVENLDLFIRPPERWEKRRPPRVMVAEAAWAEVCTGLERAGVCTFLRSSEVFQVDGQPLLNGLFGVTKDEWVDGCEVFRLIMNLTPFNGIAEPLKGDVDTLPMWSLMNPFFLQPDESLLISSEDVRCFFYTMSVPPAWYKFMAFNRLVPACCLPADMRDDEVYLASRVPPMGFANSVSLAQHVHRNLTLWSSDQPAGSGTEVAAPEAEIRKDRAVTVANPAWRIYLDNYDLLEKVKSVDLVTLTGSLSPAVLALRQEYEVWDIPRNTKKAVERGQLAEVQGAQVDGCLGVAYPRESKLLKYLAATLSLLELPTVTQKQMQVVCGGLVYVAMFRRQLLGCLNAVWKFIELFEHKQVHTMRLPQACRLELLRFVGLLPLARLDFRLEYSEQVTCSDASTTGGGLCASVALSRAGSLAAQGHLRGQLPELRQEHRVLTVGLFDGIAALRVACDLLGLQIIGHISVEKDKVAQRVVAAHFPEAVHFSDVADIQEDEVQTWARDYSQASLVLLGAGPPCQGVSGLNAQRKGALRDERSGLFPHVKRIWQLLRRSFPWCQVHCLMESVASMDQLDRDIMTADYGDEPWRCDAGTLSWTSRPRLYWISWELVAQQGVTFKAGSGDAPREVTLEAYQDLEEVCQEGWIKVDPSRPFPTFTTSRPRSRPGHKPAGVQSCSSEDLARWERDSYRYPPYQYASKNLLINKHNSLRLPSIEEKEYMLGFPVGYTACCWPKQGRGSPQHQDARHTLIGNTWSVPVVAWLLGQLCGPLGLCPAYAPQQIINFVNPEHQTYLQSRLWRSTLRPLRGPTPKGGERLVQKLGQLVSVKGEDILLSTASSQLTKFHRLRTSIPGRLWKWQIVAGWSWKGTPEHINALEMRAVLTSLKWRIQHQKQIKGRFLHLVDSLVVLHALSRGRSSSRKLRSTLSRINALLLCSSNQALWGYIQTDQNPADRPSRWGRRVRTKFRKVHA